MLTLFILFLMAKKERADSHVLRMYSMCPHAQDGNVGVVGGGGHISMDSSPSLLPPKSNRRRRLSGFYCI